MLPCLLWLTGNGLPLVSELKSIGGRRLHAATVQYCVPTSYGLRCKLIILILGCCFSLICGVQFHDFTNPNQDDDADDFFDTCDHESLPTGEMSMKHVTDQQHNDQVDVGESCHLSSAEMQVADADNIRADQPATENALLVEDLRLGKENSSMQNGVAEGAAASQCGTKSASKTASSSTKTNTKLTESIMALATFKGKEAEMSHIAQSTVAAAASMASPSNEEAPVSARTRSSLELEGQRKSQDDTCAQASALKAAASPTIALRTSHSANKGQASEEKKRGHKTEKTESGGASTTPCKSLAKKPRTEQPVSKTPNFSRFDASRGRTTAISRTPSGRASSASAADRPAKTPRSAAKSVIYLHTYAHMRICVRYTYKYILL